MNINVAFTRAYLAEVMKDVKPRTTPALRKKAWVYKLGRNHWEFQAPDLTGEMNKFYWHGSADNAYDAKAHGWCAWLRKYFPEQFNDEREE